MQAKSCSGPSRGTPGWGETLRHPHVLKHTAAMLLVQQEANAFLIRQALGDKSFDSTLAYVNPVLLVGLAPSAAEGPGQCVAGGFTVPNIESRCNQPKLGHPPPYSNQPLRVRTVLISIKVAVQGHV